MWEIKKVELRFIDSFKFISSSLDSLTNNLVKGGRKLFGFENFTPKQYELLTRKGIYPYEYMSSWDKYEERLLCKKAFYSKLNMSGVSSEDYEHACKVWREFGITNMGEYHNLYLRTDTVLLANVFEAFREVCLKNYSLDPAHFYTAPGLAWNACLKKTNIRLELLLDPDMLLMFEKGIRRGITQAVHRWAEANNLYVESYNPQCQTKYLQYLDANNLYGWVMSQPLPTGGFKWVDVKVDEISKLAKLKNKFYKLTNNSVFGKTMENIRKHKNIKLVTNREAYLKTVMKPNFRSGIMFGENLMGCEMGKTRIIMNKPVYLGQGILDLSKLIMYEFHYDYMIPKYGDKLNLCYMDTDSFVYNIETKDFYKDIAGDVATRFDTSGYLDRPLPIGLNKKVIGLMKDELGGKIMKEFVCLRPKGAVRNYQGGRVANKRGRVMIFCALTKGRVTIFSAVT